MDTICLYKNLIFTEIKTLVMFFIMPIIKKKKKIKDE